jgi:tetratricopeptide (TPR) repeat protein
MPPLLTEYVLKGVYLGVVLFVALGDPSARATVQVTLFVVGGLLIALLIAAARKMREGFRTNGKVLAFLLFLLLENPGLVYAGIILGLLLGAYSLPGRENDTWLAAAVAGGAALGVLFWLLRQVAHRWIRLGLSLALATALAAGGVFWLSQESFRLQVPEFQTAFGLRLLLGIALFYLLTFAGNAEETEIEIGAICAALGVAGWTLAGDTPTAKSLAVLLPLAIYVVYTTRVLEGLRVFKHTIRGLSYARIGRYRPALAAVRRALQLDPKNTLARETLWRMHRSMDLAQVVKEPETLALMDLDMCLERASSLLLAPRPGPEKLQEALHLLELVLNQRPELRPVVDYWRAVAHTHARAYDLAVRELEHVLDPGAFPPADPHRNSVLLQAWQLALALHPELRQRVGLPQLALPARRMEAIAAVERALAGAPDDSGAWDLKRILYSELTEAEYKAAAGGDRPAADFDHGYVEQLGLALINDSARWQRGVEYLRLAARGQPARASALFVQVAQAQQRAGLADAVWDYYELSKRAGKAFGPKNLEDRDRHEYFQVVKLLAEHARARGDFDAAVENYQLYSEYERSGLETLRMLAGVYEEKGDVLGALRTNEKALIYDPKDKDLLARKDRYYYSVMPELLRAQVDSAREGFDVEYCLRKARTLLDFKEAEPDVIAWAEHLAELAQIVRPDSSAAKVLRARALRRRGEIDPARAMLEEVYVQKPERFASGADEDAWYLACRLLGEAYLYELGKPDLAVSCFKDFRKSSKSGADTLYKLAQAYEQLGDHARAKKYYEHVVAYNGHPLVTDARDALYRMQSS